MSNTPVGYARRVRWMGRDAAGVNRRTVRFPGPVSTANRYGRGRAVPSGRPAQNEPEDQVPDVRRQRLHRQVGGADPHCVICRTHEISDVVSVCCKDDIHRRDRAVAW